MPAEERRLRADAERNRARLLEAAAKIFSERGLDVGVGEIAASAGVGRGTLFRNFPTKEALIAAIVVQRMTEATETGRELLQADQPGEALFSFVETVTGRQQVDRALFEAVGDEFMANDEIRAAYGQVLEVLSALLEQAQAAGAVRPDVGAVDVMLLVKGSCQAATAFQSVDPNIGRRQLDLMRSALSAPAAAQPLRGRAPKLEDLQQAHGSMVEQSRRKSA